MKILAIESSATVASIAIIENKKIICEYMINDKKTHSQTIMPMLESIKKQIQLDLGTLEAIAVSSGPGSYTGLRIGSSTAKGLAHVLNIPVVGISTIESMAYNIGHTEYIICPMLDARRQHVFSGAYVYEGDRLKNIIPINQIGVVELINILKRYNAKIIFLGDGYEAHTDLIHEELDGEYIIEARAIDFLPRATNLGFLAIKKLEKGEGEDYMTHQPNYYRLSQAEREYIEKHGV